MNIDTLKAFAYWLASWYLLAVAILTLFALTPFARDDTDEQGWRGKRSGVHLRIDHGTGCQYLQPTTGGLVPRLDWQGRHIGCLPN